MHLIKIDGGSFIILLLNRGVVFHKAPACGVVYCVVASAFNEARSGPNSFFGLLQSIITAPDLSPIRDCIPAQAYERKRSRRKTVEHQPEMASSTNSKSNVGAATVGNYKP